MKNLKLLNFDSFVGYFSTSLPPGVWFCNGGIFKWTSLGEKSLTSEPFVSKNQITRFAFLYYFTMVCNMQHHLPSLDKSHNNEQWRHFEPQKSQPSKYDEIYMNYIITSLIAKWLQQVSHWHEMCCHDLEVISSNSGRVELGVRSTPVRSTSVQSRTLSKNMFLRNAFGDICGIHCQPVIFEIFKGTWLRSFIFLARWNATMEHTSKYVPWLHSIGPEIWL